MTQNIFLDHLRRVESFRERERLRREARTKRMQALKAQLETPPAPIRDPELLLALAHLQLQAASARLQELREKMG